MRRVRDRPGTRALPRGGANVADSSGNREATGLAPANPRRRATSATVGTGCSSKASVSAFSIALKRRLRSTAFACDDGKAKIVKTPYKTVVWCSVRQ